MIPSNIPAFPEFRQLQISDGPVFHKLFREYPPFISEYTFTNLFAWMPQYDFHVSRMGEMLLVLTKSCGGRGGLYPPVGPWEGKDVLGLLKNVVELNIADHFHCADEKIVGGLKLFGSEITIEEETDQFDYIYSRDDLVNLAGNKFHDKKNLLRQFERKYDAGFEPLTVATIDETLKFEHSWCKTRECEKESNPSPLGDCVTNPSPSPALSEVEGMGGGGGEPPHPSPLPRGERGIKCAIFQMFSYFETLRLSGAAVRFEDKIIGITMGEPLNEDTYVIHVEKADDSYRGIYQFINQRFAQSIDPKYKWINREQDLGIPGLRRAKQSYNPVRMGKKYTIRLK